MKSLVEILSKNIGKNVLIVYRSNKHDKNYQAKGKIDSFNWGYIQLNPCKTNYPGMTNADKMGVNLERIKSVVIL